MPGPVDYKVIEIDLGLTARTDEQITMGAPTCQLTVVQLPAAVSGRDDILIRVGHKGNDQIPIRQEGNQVTAQVVGSAFDEIYLSNPGGISGTMKLLASHSVGAVFS